MPVDVQELLTRTADAPTRPLDPAAVIRRARRRRQISRTVAGLGIVSVMTIGAVPLITGGERNLEIAEQPGADDLRETAEEGTDEGPQGGIETPDRDDTAPSLPAPTAEVERHALDLASAVDLRLLTVGARELSNQLAIIDLADGETVVYPSGSYGPAIDGIQAATTTDADTVVLAQHGVITAFRGGEAQPRLVHEPTLINDPGTAPSLSLVAALEGERVWVVQVGHGGRPGSAELLDLVTGRAIVEVELPSEVHAVAASASGLVLNEDSRAVWHLSEDGQLAQVAAGEAIAAPGDWVAVLACERPTQGCELTLHHLGSGERREVSKPANGEWSGVAGPSVPTSAPRWWAGAVRNGRLLLSLQTATVDDPQTETRSGYLVIVDPDAPHNVEVVAELDGTQVAAWAHDGHRIVLMDTDWQTGGDLTVIDVRDDSAFTVPDAIPPGHFVMATN